MDKAIQKAIEGGFKLVWMSSEDTAKYISRIENKPELCLLDPLFWQALGKAEGWKSEADSYYDKIAWQEKWHHFIDWIAERKEIDLFFNELLK